MAKPYTKHEHVRTLAELPSKLVKGRIYFVDEESYIVIDHGDNRGPQIYGNRQGIQGPPGEPVPKMLNDIEAHSLAIANIELLISNLNDNVQELVNVISALIAVISETMNIDINEIKQAAANSGN